MTQDEREIYVDILKKSYHDLSVEIDYETSFVDIQFVQFNCMNS